MGRVKKKIEDHEHKKVEWLVSKWKRGEEVIPEVYEGVTIVSEEAFPIEFDNEPRLYGGVDISDSEKTALKLPPKFGLLEDVNVTQCRIQLEEAINKLRWNKIIDQDDASKDPNFYDANTRTMDINNNNNNFIIHMLKTL